MAHGTWLQSNPAHEVLLETGTSGRTSMCLCLHSCLFVSLSICRSDCVPAPLCPLSPCFTEAWPNQQGDSMTERQSHQIKCFVACFFIGYIHRHTVFLLRKNRRLPSYICQLNILGDNSQVTMSLTTHNQCGFMCSNYTSWRRWLTTDWQAQSVGNANKDQISVSQSNWPLKTHDSLLCWPSAHHFRHSQGFFRVPCQPGSAGSGFFVSNCN